MENNENNTPVSPEPVTVHPEYVKVKRAELAKLTTRKNDLEKFFFMCVETFRHLEENKPKSKFDIGGMIQFANQNQSRMDEIKNTVNEIYLNHYQDENNY